MRLWLWAAGCVQELHFFFFSGFVQYLMSFLLVAAELKCAPLLFSPSWCCCLLLPPWSCSLAKNNTDQKTTRDLSRAFLHRIMSALHRRVWYRNATAVLQSQQPPAFFFSRTTSSSFPLSYSCQQNTHAKNLQLLWDHVLAAGRRL
jgi:hypothetical protein